MAAKYSFLLLALFAINICNCQTYSVKVGPVDLLQQSRSLGNQIRNALNDLKALITTSIGDSFNAITASYNKFSTDVMAIMKASDNVIKSQISTSVSKISQLEAILRAIGQSTNCTAGKAVESRGIEVQLADDLSDCADAQIIQSTATIGGEMETVTKFNEVFIALGKELEACGDGINAVTCLLALQLKINEKRRTAPAEVKAVADKAIQLMGVATQQVKFCGIVSDAKVTFSTANIVETALAGCRAT